METLKTRDAGAHAANIQKALQELADHAHADIQRVDDPSAKALMETTCEVLNGLIQAYEHYRLKRELSLS